jgi:hypothetical protein
MVTSTLPSRQTGSLRPPHAILEEQRAALYAELAEHPDDPAARQALMRLITVQYLKQSAGLGIFLSYARCDELFAIDLAEDLRAAGLPIWLDATEIADEDDWYAKVSAALESCGLMLAVISMEAQHDDDVRAERGKFMAAGKIVLPLIYEPIKGEQPQLWMDPIDFRHDYQLGLNNLVRLLASQTATSSA